jgi:hypothetical protein
MSMRSCALLLVLSLVSPEVVNAVCELTCLHAHHHRSADALAAECHSQDASAAPAATVSAADPALCHDDARVPSAIVKASPQLAAMPALVISPRSPEFRGPAGPSLRSHPRFGPPGVLLITTQLRI